MNNRIKKATLNIITAIIYEFVAFASGLILPKLILSHFGSESNGIITSVSQFLSLISILRLGVAGATRVELYKTIANNDLEGTSSILKATEIYMRKIGIIIIFYIGALAIFYPYIVKTTLSYLDVFLLIIATGIGTFAEYFFAITYNTFLTADQSVYIYNVSQVICTLVNIVVSIILINLNFSIQIVKLSSALVFLFTPIFLNYYVKKKYKLIKNCKPNNIALSKRKDAMGHSIANIIHSNTDVVVLTLFCDIKMVSVYTIYNLVMTALKKTVEIFSTGTESIFGNMWAKKEYKKILYNLNLYEFIICIFIIIAISCTLVLILPFVSLYTKGVNDINYILPMYAVVIVIAHAFYCLRMPYLTLVQGAGHYKETKNGAYFEAFLNVITSIILVNFIGIVGTSIGTLLANVFRTYQYAFYIDNKIAHRGKKIIIKRNLWNTN